jgi:hypothetical protein
VNALIRLADAAGAQVLAGVPRLEPERLGEVLSKAHLVLE